MSMAFPRRQWPLHAGLLLVWFATSFGVVFFVIPPKRLGGNPDLDLELVAETANGQQVNRARWVILNL